MNILYSLQHLGYTIPPQADSAWLGEAGPGPSYTDPGSGGPDNDFTNRNTAFLTWNLLHGARMLKDAGGIPAHGNQRTVWDAGCRSDYPNPEHRRNVTSPGGRRRRRPDVETSNAVDRRGWVTGRRNPHSAWRPRITAKRSTRLRSSSDSGSAASTSSVIGPRRCAQRVASSPNSGAIQTIGLAPA